MPPTTNPRRTVAANVRAEMARSGVTQGGLAQALGMAQQSVSRRLNGTVAWDVEELTAVAAVLGTTVATLTAGLDAAA